MPKLNKSNKGFTIIEVVLVLAIAALIFLIVFLAVPALQRNNRNNARKNDAGRLLAAAQEYVSNNPNVADAAAVSAQAGEILDTAGNLGFYEAGNVTVDDTDGSEIAAGNEDLIRIVPGGTCSPTVDGTADLGTSARRVVALYRSETANDGDPVCQG